jgi:hypothetical protein
MIANMKDRLVGALVFLKLPKNNLLCRMLLFGSIQELVGLAGRHLLPINMLLY